jgi:hypothetical protein
MEKKLQQPTREDHSTPEESPELVGLLGKFRVFMPLIPTTIISSLLLAGNAYSWTVPVTDYETIVDNRGSVQLLVQVIASGLGLLHITVVGLLVNYSSRLKLAKAPTSLDTLQLWSNVLSRQLNWSLPLHFLILLLGFLGFCTVPAALWAAAITPVSVSAFESGTISIASYSNLSFLQARYTDRTGLPSVSTKKGMFTYNPEEAYLGSLLYSASSATTIDGSIRQHAKFDYSRFTYHGRSFGVGASVGLMDDEFTQNSLATQYEFQETGYYPIVNCIYNESAAYILNDVGWEAPDGTHVYFASGYLPNSGERQEWARYPGFNMDAIVAIGVSSTTDAVGHILGIAAGNEVREGCNFHLMLSFALKYILEQHLDISNIPTRAISINY